MTDSNNNTIDEETLEKYRRIEYGDNYEYFWRKFEHCFKITYYGSLYYINKEDTVLVCIECYCLIKQRTIQRISKTIQITINFLLLSFVSND